MISPEAADIFLEAHALDEAARAEYLARACGANTELRATVDALLTAANESEDYFRSLSDEIGLPALGADEPLPEDRVIGAWRLVRRIGRGGMGAVYLAERNDGEFEQLAALKILPTGLDTDDARARFLVERQILARLVHDNIARLLDGGVTDDGVPYFVMDYVEGLAVDEYCTRNELATKARLRLVLDVADAVQYAHRNLVIHRDLKPGNVLVDSDGRVRLLDFGIAKMLEPGNDDADLTRVARRPVTPAFASPEMLRGEPVDVTSDVYSIGALMYALLADRPPLDFTGLSVSEMCDHAANAIPPLVSRFDRTLAGDVDAIVARALARLPAERYASVESLANDIRNYLGGLPVTAKAPSPLYRARKFLRRHWVGAAFAGFAIVALATITGIALRSAATFERQAQQIALERDRAEQTKEFLVSIFDAADPNVTPDRQTALQILESGRARINAELAGQPAVQADLLEAIASVYISWRRSDEGREVLEQELDLRAAVDGEDSAAYADVLIDLAIVTDIGGDYDSSLDYARRALAIAEGIGDDEIEAAGNERVGRILHLQGDFEGADDHYGRALDILTRLHGEDSLEVSGVLEHLGNLRNHQERFEESLATIRRAIDIRRRHISGDSSEISPLYLALGSTLTDLERYDDADAAYRIGYDMNERLYGADNSYNAYFANGLGIVSERRDNYAAAAEYYEDALRLYSLHSPDSPNLAIANANVAKAHMLRDRCDLAVPFYRRSIAIFEARLQGHWARGDVKVRLGHCLTETGDLAAAESEILAGLDILSERWGPDHAYTENARATAAALYRAWGRPDRAATYE